MGYQDDLRQKITDKIVDSLRNGVKPWRRPWSGGGLPVNIISKRPYRGINTLILAIHQMTHNLQSNLYGTFNQWRDKGCKIKKRPDNVKDGQWGAGIVFFSPIKGEKELPNGEKKQYTFPMMRSYVVFSADQVEGEFADKLRQPAPAKPDIQTHEQAELLIKWSEAKVIVGGNRAYYNTKDDFIGMPERQTFSSTISYYGTHLHELAHWTSHETRCDRDIKLNRFGSASYAMEELVAEIAGCYMTAACGLPLLENLENHASYVDNWLQVLGGDTKAIFTATSAASAAADYCLKLAGMMPEPEKEEAEAVAV